MAQVDVPVTVLTRSGDDPQTGVTTPSDAVDGFLFQNDGKSWLFIENVGVSTIVITFATPQQVAGLAVAELTLSVINAEIRLIGPFPTETFNVSSGANLGKVSATTDANGTDLRIKDYRL